MNHPDMPNISPVSFNTETGTPPSVVLGPHGVAVGGIVGARSDNNAGITGVASNTSLMSISNSLVLTINSSQNLADGINFAWNNGAHIINNSWGHNGLQSNLLDDAIDNALTFGRGGLGSVVVFTSGNNNSSNSNYPANSNPLILNVGAIDRCGIRAGRTNIITEATPCDPWCATCDPGSAFGPTLDVVAGGSTISTTDRQGAMGYNTGGDPNDYANLDYTRFFGGTSAAAPQVAGVAALILSINPNLTVQEVNKIIERTAQKVRSDVYTYVTTTGRPNGTWNQFTGHGLVDACRAVYEAYASTNPINGPATLCTSDTYTLTNLPAGATVTGWSASPSGAVTLSGSGNSRTVTKVGNFNGGVTLTATISTSCGNIKINKDIHIGTPIITPINYTYSANTYPLQQYFTTPNNEVNDLYADVRGNVEVHGSTATHIEQIFATDPSSGWGTGGGDGLNGVLYPYFQFWGYDEIKIYRVTATNTCGSTVFEMGFYSWELGKLQYAVYPNPANETLTVSMGSEAERTAVPDKSSLPSFSAVLYDTQGRQIRQGESKDGAVQFDTRQLSEGTYFLHIHHGGQVEKRQVVIRH